MRAAGRALADLAGALRLLTVVPLPAPAGRTVGPGRSVAFFPLVGGFLGAALVACALLPIPAVPRAALLLVVWTGLTGGLHEDGWADTADAVLAPAAPPDRARILKDPRIGAHGLTATVLLLLLRFGALTAVPPLAVLTAPVVGRWAMAISLARAPALSPDGLGARYGRDASAVGATVMALGILVPATAVTGGATDAALAVVAAGLAGWTTARFIVARLGGLNGDGHGAVGLAAETAALWAHLPLAVGVGPWL